MGNSLRRLKLHKQNPHCHWCGVETILTCIKHIKGVPDHRMATIDHVVSRLNPKRWVKGNQQKVLACWKCNQERSEEERKRLSREEILIRTKTGFALNKGADGKPLIAHPLEKLEDVLDIFAKNGILIQ